MRGKNTLTRVTHRNAAARSGPQAGAKNVEKNQRSGFLTVQKRFKRSAFSFIYASPRIYCHPKPAGHENKNTEATPISTPTNLYDDPRFFAGYKELRAQPNNCNDLEEKPALFAMLPDMRGRSVLDLGCGFGENCAEFLRRGAARVTGVDISERMLEVAAAEHPGPEFIRGDMSDLSFLEGQYDIILSSLAVHYLEDFGGFVRQVGSRLCPGGYFIFSQEHPLNTSNPRGRFVRDEKGHVTGFTLENYLVGGRRTETWFIDDVIKYHRTFSDVINALASAGFAVMQMSEPTLDEKAAANDPEKEQKKEKRLHKPLFLIVKAVKL